MELYNQIFLWGIASLMFTFLGLGALSCSVTFRQNKIERIINLIFYILAIIYLIIMLIKH